MDVEKLIERLEAWNEQHLSVVCGSGHFACDYLCESEDCIVVQAATALSTLQAENEKLRAELEYEKEHANAYYEECGQWEAENEKLRGELESVRAERNAAVEDVAAIIGDVEEIRRGYGVDNEDADSAFARLCVTYCANNGHLCYAECEKYHCKNFKWRGQKEG